MGSVGHIKNRMNTGELYERFTKLFNEAREICDKNPRTIYTAQNLADLVCKDPNDRKSFVTVLVNKDFPAGNNLYMAQNLTMMLPGSHVIRAWWDRYILHLIEREYPRIKIAEDICTMDPVLDKYYNYSESSIYTIIYTTSKSTKNRPKNKKAYNYYSTKFLDIPNYREKVIEEYTFLKNNPDEFDKRERLLSKLLNYLYSIPGKKSIDEIAETSDLTKDWLIDFFLSEEGRCYSNLLRDFNNL